MLTPSLVVDVLLFVLSLLWCREMFGRWRSDLDELRQATNHADRAAIVVWWLVTILAVSFIVSFVIGIFSRMFSW